jgi:hypothetical protein
MKIEAKTMKIETLGNGAFRILTDEDVKEINKKQLIDLIPGTVFTEGSVRFVVLEHKECGTVVIEASARPERVFDEDTPDWAASDLRNYLNIEVLKEYEAAFGKDNIIESETDLTTLDGLNNYGTCMDKVRLLTFEEYRKYQHLFVRESNLEWTCTAWSSKERGWEYSVCVVSPQGYIGSFNCFNYIGVRPLCILKSNIFVSLEENENE